MIISLGFLAVYGWMDFNKKPYYNITTETRITKDIMLNVGFYFLLLAILFGVLRKSPQSIQPPSS
jgi:hypothetical protein